MKVTRAAVLTAAAVAGSTGCVMWGDNGSLTQQLRVSNDTTGTIIVTTDEPPDESYTRSIAPGSDYEVHVPLDDDACTQVDVIITDKASGEELQRVERGFCLGRAGTPRNTITVE